MAHIVKCQNCHKQFASNAALHLCNGGICDAGEPRFVDIWDAFRPLTPPARTAYVDHGVPIRDEICRRILAMEALSDEYVRAGA